MTCFTSSGTTRYGQSPPPLLAHHRGAQALPVPLCRQLFLKSTCPKPLAAPGSIPHTPLAFQACSPKCKATHTPLPLMQTVPQRPKAAKQHRRAKPKKAFLLLPTTLSPTATQGWASAMLSDESKQWRRAGRQNFWPMHICPLCTHPALRSRIPPGWRQPLAQPQCSAGWKEPPWTPSPAKLYLHLATA